MKWMLLFTVGLASLFSVAYAQDSIRYRVILIGDAGEINSHQQSVIGAAAAFVLPAKTTVLYLGDNIYPRGMDLPGGKQEALTGQILKSQFSPMRAKNASVYFVPGNHDWDKMGPNGLAKIKAESNFLEAQGDSLLHLLPANGCPGPVAIDLTDSLTIIAFDSEWWLFPFSTYNPSAECGCTTKKEFSEKLQELLYENRHKVVLLASHHPFQSYGEHGGVFSLKENIFPLTAVNKNLWLPLPVVGSLYPILRRALPNPEDIGHPLYKGMISTIEGASAGFPNLIYIAGHDHGLQFIKDEQIQVVSGGGSKGSRVKKGRHSLFASKHGGFVVADFLAGNSIRFTYFTLDTGKAQASFSYIQPYTRQPDIAETVNNTKWPDSVLAVAYGGFDQVSRFHRLLFGENYRREWSAPTKLPVIRLSEFRGGLVFLREGGGNQTKSLRFRDKDGVEWVLRSVRKYPDAILPEDLKESFVSDIVTDAMSAQHPYSALMVPPLANATHVPHASPIIGVVAPDPKLGVYAKTFENTICLLEEREPTGKSEAFSKMFDDLNSSNSNDFDSASFLRARLLDIYIGDWDRHGDQWRAASIKTPYGKRFIAVPRDRDQALYINQGVLPYLESRPWIQPFFEGFKPTIRNPGTLIFTSTLFNARLINQFSYEEWTQAVNEFVAALTDSVLETAVRQLPQSAYLLRHDKLIRTLKARRADLPRAMKAYYTFLNKSAFIQTSDKNEFVQIEDAPNNGVQITIYKLSKKGVAERQLFSKTYYPSITHEIRLFTGKGDDSVAVDVKNSSIKLRITGGTGDKRYDVIAAKRKIAVYDNASSVTFYGTTNCLRLHLSNDSANTAVVPGNLFNVVAPILSAGYNLDDGLIFGLGFRYTRGLDYTHPAFSTRRYTSFQELTVAHSFSTNAFHIRYSSEWVRAIANADLLLKGSAFAPDNTQNFFGLGNETEFNKTGNYKKYYRARFSLYDVESGLKWSNRTHESITVGPLAQYYHFDSAQNNGRFIENASLLNTYDSANIGKNKVHAGLFVTLTSDTRNKPLLPGWGSFVKLTLKGYEGLNSYSRSFAQVFSEVRIYKSLDARSNFVVADRLGAEASAGNPAFYQSLFLGGQGNLLGYRQYRFAGDYVVYNNLEVRLKIADLASYILPGQLGLIGLFDVGRVWQKDDQSRLWHNGSGGGFYFSPAQLIVIEAVVAHSTEGSYPYITLGLRF